MTEISAWNFFFGMNAAFEKKRMESKIASLDDLSRNPDKKAGFVRFQNGAQVKRKITLRWVPFKPGGKSGRDSTKKYIKGTVKS